MANISAVSLRNVSKIVGNKKLVQNLTFDVPRGEIFGFLGPNGAGKTTTIRMMVGLSSISEGEITINGINVAKNFEEAVKHVGAIIESPDLYSYLSGYHNLLHFAKMTPSVTEERIHEVAKLVGLEGRLQDRVNTYSLGMRQRLGLAQALLHKPSVLILDEPTNGVDPAGIRELRDYFRELAVKEGVAVIVSSHLLAEMELMCDRVAILQQGKLVDIRLVSELRTDSGHHVVFEVDDADKAEQALLSVVRKENINRVEKGLSITAEHELIPELNSRMVMAGCKVFSITPLSHTLEEKFLEMTGSEHK